MAWVSIAIAAVGLVAGIAGNEGSKRAAKKAAAARAQEQRIAAAQTRAIGQRQASQERKQARLVASALQARAKGGGLDPGVAELDEDIFREGEYRALSALFSSEMDARSLERQAAAGIDYTRAQARAYNWQTAGTAADYGSRMYARYRDSPPPQSTGYSGQAGWSDSPSSDPYYMGD